MLAVSSESQVTRRVQFAAVGAVLSPALIHDGNNDRAEGRFLTRWIRAYFVRALRSRGFHFDLLFDG
jgi:hypothetical protein